jgi:ADP-heptose:LPS heptosyltransferase
MPVIILSPFTRWASKDWPLKSFLESGSKFSSGHCVIVTGARNRAHEIDACIDGMACGKIQNLAGKLSLGEFAELVRRADLMLSGDSFPMHVAVACGTQVIALFGPTEESRVGPRDGKSSVLRAPDCRKCDRSDCNRGCLAKIPVSDVVSQIQQAIGAPQRETKGMG